MLEQLVLSARSTIELCKSLAESIQSDSDSGQCNCRHRTLSCAVTIIEKERRVLPGGLEV